MALDIIVRDVGTGVGSKVDANGNALVNLPKVGTQAGYVGLLSINDEGAASGTPYTKAPRTSEDHRLSVGIDTPMFDYTFNATAQNTAVWKFSQGTTGMAAVQGSGFLTLNSGSVLTTNAAVGLQTWRVFPLRGNASMHAEFACLFTAASLVNQVFEAGLFFTSATGATPTAPTDGTFFRLTNAGLIGVLTFNGVETATGVLVAPGNVPINASTTLKILLSEEAVEFWKDDVFLGEIAVPAGNGQPFLSTALPLTFQTRNAGTVSGTPMLPKISDCHVDQTDLLLSKPYSHQQAAHGLSGYQGQDGGTMGSTALLTNSLAAGAGAAMTNTTAALGSGLGGQFTALPSLAVPTDGIVCSFQVPQGGVNQTPRNLIITGVKVQGLVTAVLTGGPVFYAYSLAFGHTVVSLATVEGTSFVTNPTTKAPRRIALGYETYVVTAPVGTLGQGVTFKFDTPIIVNPGEFIALCAKNLGTVATVGTITFLVTFDGYFQ